MINRNSLALIDEVIQMNEEDLALAVLALRTVTTLPREQVDEIHSLMINEGLPLTVAAARLGIVEGGEPA